MNARLTTLDLPALMAQLQRGAIGFDRMFEELNRSTALTDTSNYPPHNTVKLSDTDYAIEVAVAGFAEDELEVLVDRNVITITGQQKERADREYIHRGIACRAFTKVLNLAEHLVVREAKFENGLLVIGIE
jgi:molecular chaperone IbpA